MRLCHSSGLGKGWNGGRRRRRGDPARGLAVGSLGYTKIVVIVLCVLGGLYCRLLSRLYKAVPMAAVW